MERIKAFFTRGNLLYKIVALFMAILLWLAIKQPFSL